MSSFCGKSEKCDLGNQINERLFSSRMDLNRYKNDSNCTQDAPGVYTNGSSGWAGPESAANFDVCKGYDGKGQNKFFGVAVVDDLVAAESELMNLTRPIDSKYMPACIPQVTEGELYDTGLFSSSNMAENAKKCKDGIPCDCSRDESLNLMVPSSCKVQLPNRYNGIIRKPDGCETNVKELAKAQKTVKKHEEDVHEEHAHEEHEDHDHEDEETEMIDSEDEM